MFKTSYFPQRRLFLKKIVERLLYLVRKFVNNKFVPTTKFVAQGYEVILGRKPDEAGFRNYVNAIRFGKISKIDFLTDLAKSDEYTRKILSETIVLKNIREGNDTRCQEVVDTVEGGTFLAYRAVSDEDFDWIESQILENGYYEKPGIWSYSDDPDKINMAKLLSSFQPKSYLEFGCSSGWIMKHLADRGVLVKGLDISTIAKEKAHSSIRSEIVLQDLLDFQSENRFSLIAGLDIYEHLNPRKLGKYLDAIEGLLSEDGFLYCNIPAFGNDDVFGEVFEIYSEEWKKSAKEGKKFDLLHADAEGYPINGHLIWAHTKWWEEIFAKHGFHREREIEKSVHREFGASWKNCPARSAIYVFSKKDGNPDISKVLKGFE